MVTPAQAGVQADDFWIPACAGMTDGGVRPNDGMVFWIPAFAGTTDGGVRRND